MNRAKSDAIARLNDATRQLRHGQTIMTPAVSQLHEIDRAAMFGVLARYDAFTPDNDPKGLRDSGFIHKTADGIWVQGLPQTDGTFAELVHWHIDYYNLNFDEVAQTPENSALTHRILTIVSVSEM